MFKFNFEVDQDPEIDELLNSQDEPPEDEVAAETVAGEAPFTENPLDKLLKTLPNIISFSPIHIPTLGDGTFTLSRRDLFDARFQLMSNSSQSDEKTEQEPELEDLAFVEAPSDLIPGVYEGGLKTWECSIDLASQLHEICRSTSANSSRGKRILELGCGTAVPSISILREIFTLPPTSNRRTAIHLQDYNELVFRLAVLPNIILAWYMSPAAYAFRENADQVKSPNGEDDDAFPPADPNQPGDLPITSSLTAAFLTSLEQYGIDLRFFYGSWESFDLDAAGGKYDIVLTSETIYRIESLPSLLDLMWRACTTGSKSLEDLANRLDITSERSEGVEYLCIVAAKLVYFGVGGGVTEFIDAVENARGTRCGRHSGTVDTIWKRDEGVKRVIMKVQWN